MATTGTAVDVVMPQMGVSVSEGTITKWLKSEGEAIAADESLLEISTDKVDTEVPSPASGVLQQILAQEGETVAVGTKIAVIAPEGAEVEAEAPPEPPTQEAAQEAEEASPHTALSYRPYGCSDGTWVSGTLPYGGRTLTYGQCTIAYKTWQGS